MVNFKKREYDFLARVFNEWYIEIDDSYCKHNFEKFIKYFSNEIKPFNPLYNEKKFLEKSLKE